MKIGLYDSGLGGLSVLNRLMAKYPEFDYIYFGDSARAPYGDKSQAELTSFVYEIFDFMQDQQVDYLISACNTSSMFLDQIDLSNYDFKVISLFEVMKEYFAINLELEASKCACHGDNNLAQQIALLATPTNIDSKRYLDWDVAIYPVKCPKLVPLLESGNLTEAKVEFNNYLNDLPKEIHNVIVGCTHYSFLTDKSHQYNFIDPADALIRSSAFREAISEAKYESYGSAKIFCSGDLDLFKRTASQLNVAGVEYYSKKLGSSLQYN